MNWKPHYSRFLEAHKGYLHLCAHSHHFWLDVTREAQLQAWDVAAQLSDRKWDYVFSQVLPQVQSHIVQELSFSSRLSQRLSFAPNTHELYNRLLSCFDGPIRVLSTDSEFHSFRRQSERLSENKNSFEMQTLSQFPRETFADRFLTEAQKAHNTGKAYDVIFLSHVFFNTGAVVPDCEKLLKALAPLCKMLVLDTYHSFYARPFSLQGLEEDVYVLGGAYKYLQGGEGACFLYTPPKAEELRPSNTGWFAHFASLEGPRDLTNKTQYSEGAFRFWGSTFDPSALFRLKAVFDFFNKYDLNVEKIHAHSLNIQETCLEKILNSQKTSLAPLKKALDTVIASKERGNFISFTLAPHEAQQTQQALKTDHILSDSRESGANSYLRFGTGLYHDPQDIELYF